MSHPPPSDSPSESNSSVNFTGGETNVQGDVIGGDQIIQGDKVAQKIVFAPEQVYDVHCCENPYLGLAAFTYAERANYAGRKKLIDETVARLTAPAAPIALLFVTGASGSGKSSFAQAGLLPALETHYSRFTVEHAVMRPAGDPFASLNDALWRQLRISETSQVFGNLRGLEDTPPSQINLLVLDQFEEFFTQSPQAAGEAFFAWLAQLPPFAKTRTHIIATMRADYLPELLNHPALYEIAKRGVDLRAMDPPELSQAIQQPLRASPYADTKRFEPGLVDKLAEDTAQDAAYLPLLQVTLQEIWRKGWLKREAYTNLTDAIKQRADQVVEFQDFDDAVPDEKRSAAEQTALLDILLDLVDVSTDDDTRRDVRKQRTREALTRGEVQRERWVKQLADARLLSIESASPDGTRIEVDLIHETLLTNWARLQKAIAARRSSLRRRARFEQNLDEWETQKRAPAYLLEGVRLAEARELEAGDDIALRNEDAKTFLRASNERAVAQEKRRVRNLWLVAAILAVLVLLSGAAAVYAFVQQNEAVNQAAIANQAVATSREEANARATAEADALAQAAAAKAAQATAEAEAQRADAQAKISDSRALAAQSVAARNENLPLAYLLGIEASKAMS